MFEGYLPAEASHPVGQEGRVPYSIVIGATDEFFFINVGLQLKLELGEGRRWVVMVMIEDADDDEDDNVL